MSILCSYPLSEDLGEEEWVRILFVALPFSFSAPLSPSVEVGAVGPMNMVRPNQLTW